MYAVIKTGGKQYKVAQGDTLRVEKLSADVGANIDFNNVLLVADNDNIKIGTPQVPGGKVLATVQEHGRGKKIKIIKFKRRKQYYKRMGHRQSFTDVKITSIMADGIETPPMITETETQSAVSDTPSHVETQTIEATLHTRVSETPTTSATP
jgi:large subunit ribosomal protein L21